MTFPSFLNRGDGRKPTLASPQFTVSETVSESSSALRKILTRAALSTCRRPKGKFLSVISLYWYDPFGLNAAAACRALSIGLRLAGASEALGGGPLDPVADFAAAGLLVGTAFYAGYQFFHSPAMSEGLPPGYWPGDKGAAEWGRRNGVGAKEGKNRFHDLKKGDSMSQPKHKYGVNPTTGDVADPEGNSIGNLGERGDGGKCSSD